MTCKGAHLLLLVLIVLLATLSSLPGYAAAVSGTPLAVKVEMGGVGLQVVPVATGEIVVIAVLPESPAAQARLLPGDLIIAVAGKSLRGSNFAAVTRSLLWGKAGTKVELTWLRPGEAGKKSAQLVRAALKDDPAQNPEVQMLVPAAIIPPETAKP